MAECPQMKLWSSSSSQCLVSPPTWETSDSCCRSIHLPDNLCGRFGYSSSSPEWDRRRCRWGDPECGWQRPFEGEVLAGGWRGEQVYHLSLPTDNCNRGKFINYLLLAVVNLPEIICFTDSPHFCSFAYPCVVASPPRSADTTFWDCQNPANHQKRARPRPHKRNRRISHHGPTDLKWCW